MRPALAKRGLFAALSVAVAAALVGAVVAESVRIAQRDEKFHPGAIELRRGDVLSVTNDDPFVHHLFVESPRFNYDSGLQRPGRTLAITFDRPGDYVLECAIHLKMKLKVTVKEK